MPCIGQETERWPYSRGATRVPMSCPAQSTQKERYTMNALPSIAEQPQTKKSKKVLLAGNHHSAVALAAAGLIGSVVGSVSGGGFKEVSTPPRILTLAHSAGLFEKVKSEPLTEEQEDAVISAASTKRKLRQARNLKNKANGGF